MTPSQAAAVILSESVALVVGYLLRPFVDRLRSERRFRRHCRECSVCGRVSASCGPAWLYCGEGRGMIREHETPEQFEARARQKLREAMGAVPMTRSRDVH